MYCTVRDSTEYAPLAQAGLATKVSHNALASVYLAAPLFNPYATTHSRLIIAVASTASAPAPLCCSTQSHNSMFIGSSPTTLFVASYEGRLTRLDNSPRLTRKGSKYFCDHPGCHDAFNWRFSLKRHLTTHSGEEMFKCDQCPKWFAEKVTLIHHIGIHTDDERLFRCSLDGCTRCFSGRANVERHEQLHELQKAYKLPTAWISEKEEEREVMKKRTQGAKWLSQLRALVSEKLEEVVTVMQDAVERTSGQVQRRPAEQRAEAAEGQLTAVTAERDDARLRLLTSTTECNQLRQAQQSTVAMYDEQHSKLRAEQWQSEELHTQLQTERTRCVAAEVQLQAERARYAAAEVQLAAHSEELHTQRAILDSLSVRVETTSNSNNALHAEYQAALMRVEDRQLELNGVKQQLAAVREQLSDELWRADQLTIERDWERAKRIVAEREMRKLLSRRRTVRMVHQPEDVSLQEEEKINSEEERDTIDM